MHGAPQRQKNSRSWLPTRVMKGDYRAVAIPSMVSRQNIPHLAASFDAKHGESAAKSRRYRVCRGSGYSFASQEQLPFIHVHCGLSVSSAFTCAFGARWLRSGRAPQADAFCL
jgi:hypothetical protein